MKIISSLLFYRKITLEATRSYARSFIKSASNRSQCHTVSANFDRMRCGKVVPIDLFEKYLTEFCPLFAVDCSSFTLMDAGEMHGLRDDSGKTSCLKVNVGALRRRRTMHFFDSADWVMQAGEACMRELGRRLSGGKNNLQPVSKLAGCIESADSSSGSSSPLWRA
jgi:hypothetical protein